MKNSKIKCVSWGMCELFHANDINLEINVLWGMYAWFEQIISLFCMLCRKAQIAHTMKITI